MKNKKILKILLSIIVGISSSFFVFANKNENNNKILGKHIARNGVFLADNYLQPNLSKEYKSTIFRVKVENNKLAEFNNKNSAVNEEEKEIKKITYNAAAVSVFKDFLFDEFKKSGKFSEEEMNLISNLKKDIGLLTGMIILDKSNKFKPDDNFSYYQLLRRKDSKDLPKNLLEKIAKFVIDYEKENGSIPEVIAKKITDENGFLYKTNCLEEFIKCNKQKLNEFEQSINNMKSYNKESKEQAEKHLNIHKKIISEIDNMDKDKFKQDVKEFLNAMDFEIEYDENSVSIKM